MINILHIFVTIWEKCVSLHYKILYTIKVLNVIRELISYKLVF